MANIKCFLIEKDGSTRRYFGRVSDVACPNGGTHNARVRTSDGKESDNESSYLFYRLPPEHVGMFPTNCSCGYTFVDGEDKYDYDVDVVWVRADNKEIIEGRGVNNAPVGAMWDADWFHDTKEMCGPDGKSINVMTPGGPWCIDQRASNCTLPQDNVHRCWVRHGEPPEITVDKNGNTCAAGAGSILIGKYHGFLRNGHLTDC